MIDVKNWIEAISQDFDFDRRYLCTQRNKMENRKIASIVLLHRWSKNLYVHCAPRDSVFKLTFF